MFPIILYLHVIFAISALGANVVYGILLPRANREPSALPFTLKTIKFLDDRLANPSYALLLVTGLLMVILKSFSFTTPWLLAALVLYAILIGLGLLGYTPSLRRRIRLIESEGTDSQAYKLESKRGLIIGLVEAVVALGILYLMVIHPRLWGNPIPDVDLILNKSFLLL